MSDIVGLHTAQNAIAEAERLRAENAELREAFNAARWFLADFGRQKLPRDFSPEVEKMRDAMDKVLQRRSWSGGIQENVAWIDAARKEGQ
jgi:hypothetical protein